MQWSAATVQCTEYRGVLEMKIALFLNLCKNIRVLVVPTLTAVVWHLVKFGKYSHLSLAADFFFLTLSNVHVFRIG